jgi:hypothetical protein
MAWVKCWADDSVPVPSVPSVEKSRLTSQRWPYRPRIEDHRGGPGKEFAARKGRFSLPKRLESSELFFRCQGMVPRIRGKCDLSALLERTVDDERNVDIRVIGQKAR